MSRLTIDPRLVPVCRLDAHLPAVPTTSLTPQALRARFEHPPTWQPELRAEAPYLVREVRTAAVLIGIVTHPVPTVLLTQRSPHLSTHADQVALPGGRSESGDASLVQTALREAHEEVGLDPTRVAVLGALPAYLTGSSYHVTPVVGLVQPGAAWQAQPSEVTQVFEVPLAYLMNPAHHRWHRLDWQGRERQWYSMPYPEQTQAHYIWGVTAGILRNLYRFLSA